MIFGANIITPTGQTPSPPSDSGSPALGKSATGSIRSQSFLAAPNLQPGGIQELIHGCSALLTTPGRVPGDIQVIVKGGWNRTIQQYENVTVKGDSTHEHDDSLYAEFALPGTLENTFLNGDVSRYYLNGHHLTINDILTETIGVGGSGSEVTLNTLRFGDDRITARAGSNCDLQVILGDSTSVHVGNTWFDWATGAVSRIIAGAHFESYQDSSQGGASGQLSQMRSKDAHDLHTSLNAMLGSDPGRLPHWNAPSSSSWFQLKTLLFPGINWNLKATMEFTYAGSRAAWTGWGGAFRGYHSFVNGLYFVGKGIKAAFDALHANFAALCGRVNLFGFGNPRAIFPSPPPTPADADAALSAAELAQEAEGAAAALGKTAETAAKVAAATPQAAAQEALDEATARETAAQAAVDDLTPKFNTAEGNLGAAQTERDAAAGLLDTANQGLDGANEAVARAEATLDSTGQAFENSEAELRQVQETFDNANTELGDARQAFDNANTRLGQVQEADEVASAEQALRGANTRLEQAQQAFENANTRLGAAQQAFDEASANLQQSENRFGQAVESRNAAEQAVQRAQDRLDQADRDLADAASARNEAKQALDGAKEKLTQAQGAVRDANGKLTDARRLQGDAEAKRRLADAAKTNAENKRAAAKQALGKIKPPDGVGPVAPALGGSGVTTGRLPYPTVQDHSPFDKHKGTKPPWQK